MESQQTPETSVLFSLAELAELEQERIREDERARAGEREAKARAQRQVIEEQQAAARAQVEADRAAKAQREREREETQARIKARTQAAVDVARIEAAAKVKLEAENAARAHELAVIRVRTERRGSAIRRVLGVMLGAVICAGSAAAYGLNGQVSGLERENGQLRAEQQALVESSAKARQSQLELLDRRHVVLRADPGSANATAEREAARQARSGVDESDPAQRQLAAFGDALDSWEKQLARQARLQLLDRRRADLLAWAASERKRDLGGPTERASTLAHAAKSSREALAAYERSLDQLRDELGRPAGGRVTPHVTGPAGQNQATCTNSLDPLCGLDGKPL